jgi:cytoskeletal protein CcmA (bactofilin family)
LSVTRSLFRGRFQSTIRSVALLLIGVAALGSVSLTSLASVVTTDRYIVTDEDVVDEDVYVTSVSSTIEGVVDGDLVIFTGDLTITGEVTGSVTVFSSGSVVVSPTGSIAGSLNGVAVNATVAGDVAGDVLLTAPSIVVLSTGTVGRDAVLFGGTARIEGFIGRDVRGRTLRLVVDGTVGGDIDVATQKLEFGPDAVVGGDVLYRSPVEARGATSATIEGTLTRLPTQSNFVYGIILWLANIVGFLGFVVAGIVVLWVIRGSSARATGSVLLHPFKSLAAGIATAIALPLAIVVLSMTLVGIPLAVILVLIGIVLFIIGPLPAVTALGHRVLFGRGGLFGAFVAGAALWRFGIWIIPVVGGLLYVLAMVWGIGGWVLGVIATRRAEPVAAPLLPQRLARSGPAGSDEDASNAAAPPTGDQPKA